MQMETTTGLVRPGHHSVNAGATGAGLVGVDVEHEGTTIRILLTPDEAEQLGVGCIGAATLERAALAARTQPIVNANGGAARPLRSIGAASLVAAALAGIRT